MHSSACAAWVAASSPGAVAAASACARQRLYSASWNDGSSASARSKCTARPPVVAQRELGVAQPVERLGEVGPQAECPLEARLGGIVVAALQQRVAEVRVHFRQPRIEPACRFELGDGRIELPQSPAGDRAVAAIDRVPAVDDDRLRQHFGGLAVAAQLHAEHGRGIERLGVGRPGGLQQIERVRSGHAIARLHCAEALRDQPAVETHWGWLPAGSQAALLLAHR